MRMIVGLGNPGKEYEGTRHNIGFKVVDFFAERKGVNFGKSKEHVLSGEFNHDGEKILIIKPQTYMNLSGQAVGALARWHKVAPEQILVIYDDLDLPVGKVRIRARGSAGGHNGMKSLIAHLNTEDFARIKVGIGRPPVDKETADYVLSNFLPTEREAIQQAISQSAEAVQVWLDKGLIEAMNRFSK